MLKTPEACITIKTHLADFIFLSLAFVVFLFNSTYPSSLIESFLSIDFTSESKVRIHRIDLLICAQQILCHAGAFESNWLESIPECQTKAFLLTPFGYLM